MPQAGHHRHRATRHRLGDRPAVEGREIGAGAAAAHQHDAVDGERPGGARAPRPPRAPPPAPCTAAWTGRSPGSRSRSRAAWRGSRGTPRFRRRSRGRSPAAARRQREGLVELQQAGLGERGEGLLAARRRASSPRVKTGSISRICTCRRPSADRSESSTRQRIASPSARLLAGAGEQRPHPGEIPAPENAVEATDDLVALSLFHQLEVEVAVGVRLEALELPRHPDRGHRLGEQILDLAAERRDRVGGLEGAEGHVSGTT